MILYKTSTQAVNGYRSPDKNFDLAELRHRQESHYFGIELLNFSGRYVSNLLTDTSKTSGKTMSIRDTLQGNSNAGVTGEPTTPADNRGE